MVFMVYEGNLFNLDKINFVEGRSPNWCQVFIVGLDRHNRTGSRVNYVEVNTSAEHFQKFIQYALYESASVGKPLVNIDEVLEEIRRERQREEDEASDFLPPRRVGKD